MKIKSGAEKSDLRCFLAFIWLQDIETDPPICGYFNSVMSVEQTFQIVINHNFHFVIFYIQHWHYKRETIKISSNKIIWHKGHIIKRKTV